MGGSASVTLLPLANDCLQRVADVARNVRIGRIIHHSDYEFNFALITGARNQFAI